MKNILLLGNRDLYQNPHQGFLKFEYLAVACFEVGHNFLILQAAKWECIDPVLYYKETAPPLSLWRDQFQQTAYY